MDEVPKELLDQIADLALAMVNARSVGDDVVAESIYLRLRELYQTRIDKGEPHPFLTEVVADFTLDNVESIRFYKEAIRQCSAFPDESIHSKMISLAETLVKIARFEEAEAYLVTAREHASRFGDVEALTEIDNLLGKLSKR